MLRKLSHEVQSLMCASAHINSYKKAVEELVYNALDADATSIAIRVHINDGTLQVIDNGHGIQKTDFHLLGQRHTTSRYLDKATNNDKYGMAGVSLANIIEVSKHVKVTSRFEKEDEAMVKEFCKGKERKPYVTKRPSKGTTVQIKGFLYNKEISRKSINVIQTIQEIKSFLEQISLMHTNISLSLRDEDKNEIIFQIPKNRDIYKTFDLIFGIQQTYIQELKVEKNDYKVTGFIEKKVLEIDVQWVFLNNKIVSRKNKVYKILKEYLKSTRQENRDPKLNTKWQQLNDDCLLKNHSPFYIIFIQCPTTDYNTRNSYFEFKNWKLIEKLLKKLTQFYHGDLQVRELRIDQNQNRMIPQTDIRDQVKKIMDKFLGNGKFGVSQLQNGVTGKLINRKSKKKIKRLQADNNKKINKLDIQIKTQQNILHKTNHKNQSNKRNDPECSDSNEKLSDGVEIGKFIEKDKVNLTRVVNRSKSQKGGKANKIRHRKDNGIRRKRKSKYKKTKPIKEIDSIIKKFINPTESIRQRCNSISRKANEVLNHIRPKKHIFVKENMFHSNTVEGNKQISVRKRVNEIIIHDFNPLPPKNHRTNMDKPCNKPTNKFLSTYDLLSTILLSQCGPKETLEDYVQYQSTRKKELTEKNGSPLTSKLTYQSHCYNTKNKVINDYYCNDNLHNARKKPKQFISIPSKNNFEIYPNKNLPDSPKLHLIEETSKLTEDRFKSKPQFNSSIYHTESQFESYLLPESPKVLFNELNKTISSQAFPTSIQETQSSYFENIRETYSISNHNTEKSIYHNSNNGHNSRDINEVDTNELSNKVVQDSLHENDLANAKQLQSSSIISNLDPMDICETVMKISDEDNEMISFISDSNLCDNMVKQTAHNNHNKETETVSHYSGSLECPDININFIQNINSRLRSSYFDNQIFDTAQSDKMNKYGATEKYFGMRTRFRFVPKGMSQIFKNCNSKIDCSYNFDKDYFTNNLYNEFVNNVQMNSEIFDPMLKETKDGNEKGIEKLIKKVNMDSASLKFNAHSIKHAKVLGQVDNKFIAAIVIGNNHNEKGTTESLVLFDQHAVDERIRLERNMTDYKENGQWKKVPVDNILLVLNKDEILYLHNYKDKFSQFGLEWDILSNDKIILKSVPKAIPGNVNRPLDKVMAAIKKVIIEEIKAIKLQSGCVSLYPKAIMDLVFSEACRYAIKFGDKLTTKQCVDMLDCLSECKMPFQCAHGRPVMAVLIDVTKNNYEYKVNMAKLKKFKLRFCCIGNK